MRVNAFIFIPSIFNATLFIAYFTVFAFEKSERILPFSICNFLILINSASSVFMLTFLVDCFSTLFSGLAEIMVIFGFLNLIKSVLKYNLSSEVNPQSILESERSGDSISNKSFSESFGTYIFPFILSGFIKKLSNSKSVSLKRTFRALINC